MAERIANHKAANETESTDTTGDNPLEAAAQAFELSLEMEPEPEPEEPQEEDENAKPQFGMGHLGGK